MAIFKEYENKILKQFSIANRDNEDNFCETCQNVERSDEAIKDVITDIPILINNNYKFKCTNKSDLEWFFNMESLSKKKWRRNSLTKDGKFILKEIKNHITHIFHWLKTSFKSALDL